jgi:hypothetical protein
VNKLSLLGVLMGAVLSFHVNAQGQNTPYLERIITVSINHERVDEALKKISQQAGFIFSYNPAILEADKPVTYNGVNKTVREVLDQLFNGTIQYKVRGKYVILTRNEIGSSKKEPQVYSGYVVDEATGERLKNVSIYDPVTLSSTVTDSYGYFEIEISKPTRDLRLAINKQNYSDTLVVPPTRGRLLNIPLSVNTDRMNTFADSVGNKFKRFWSRAKKFTVRQANMENIRDTIHRATQLSFVPFIGTNHAMSGNVINDFSFNILGGYSLGVKMFEIGGVFNIVRENVTGAQLAGIFNAVGGDVKGAQVAGIFNTNLGTTSGAQLAGIFNFDWGHTRYFSGAGIFNFARHGSHAVQVAGIGNMTIKDQESPQLAGLFNFSSGNANTQVAGVYNLAAGNAKGWQGAGVINVAGKDVNVQTAGVINVAGKSVRGGQLAGVVNFAGKELRGIQLAGVLNYATKVRGAQIGLINIADSVGGVPIGLFSVVLKGYHKIELAADEVFYTNVAFRTGVHNFYNILTAGAKPSTFGGDATLWTFGYGFGTAPKLSRKLYLNFDVTSNHLVQGNSIEALNLLNKAYLGVDFQMMRKMSLTFGATLNAYVTETSYDGYQKIFSHYRPEIIYKRDFGNDITMQIWLGGKIGLRFL